MFCDKTTITKITRTQYSCAIDLSKANNSPEVNKNNISLTKTITLIMLLASDSIHNITL